MYFHLIKGLDPVLPGSFGAAGIQNNEAISKAIFDFDSILRNTHYEEEKLFLSQNPFYCSKTDNFLNLGGLDKTTSPNQNFLDFETLLLSDSDRGMTL